MSWEPGLGDWVVIAQVRNSRFAGDGIKAPVGKTGRVVIYDPTPYDPRPWAVSVPGHDGWSVRAGQPNPYPFHHLEGIPEGTKALWYRLDELRPATPEEIAQARLASLGTEDAL